MNVTTFSALAEPNRFQIVELLKEQPLTVGEIATRLQIRQPQASKHLRVLSDAGVVEVQAVANRRICRLRPEAFEELDSWLGPYRRLWSERFEQLDNYLQQLQHPGEESGVPDPPPQPPADPATP
ncbi:metalloregulator ArsR/SmtB family transcription factor [Deinococcus deserti]|uniref:Putative Transcriptional regulator, ArsR family n=1 Tax=Deinococcus deserti (strain DSM 17065 / CIP 109153 / LMG 22923 / VCD115) TaxID=546414 RepID=C1CW61_DEIDV|nr:metalloregulator ArsR/SmtB family transcription factor [Deinococcus deserti]ACO46428.1 putative Transcriptional regulator, ArsR family [Deinococcus deserti VCD115]